MSKLTRSRNSEATKDLQSSKRQKVNEFDEDEDDKAIEKKSDAETVTGGENQIWCIKINHNRVQRNQKEQQGKNYLKKI